MTPLSRRFAAHLASLELPPGPRLLAVSGGPDSMALLHLMAPLAPPDSLIVAHIDHGIHPLSGDAARLVQRTAAALGVPCLVVELKLGAGTTETEARTARYEALRAVAAARGALIFTAHHRDDQVETVLIRVLAGSGPAGLAAMQPVTAGVVRPLLPFSRTEIREWIRGAGVEFWEDPANRDPRHLRSWVRTEVLPLLQSHLPDLDRRLIRLARWARENRSGWDAVLDLLPLGLEIERHQLSLLASSLVALPDSLASQLIQAAARRAGLVVGPVAAARLLALIQRGESGQRVDLGAGLKGEIAFQRVLVGPEPPVSNWEVEIRGETGDAVADGWQCRWNREPAPVTQDRAALVAWFDPATSYQVRRWRPGDRILPLGGTGHRLIVRCMQDRRVARRDRPGWPVLVDAQEVPVWVPGVMRSGRALPVAGQPALRVEFTRVSEPPN